MLTLAQAERLPISSSVRRWLRQTRWSMDAALYTRATRAVLTPKFVESIVMRPSPFLCAVRNLQRGER